MTESRKIVLRQTARIAIGQAVCLALMFGVFALLHKLNLTVILGGLVGAVLAVANFFSLALVVTLAADKAQAQDVAGGQKLVKGSYPIRILVLAVLLIACAASGYCNVLALALPLLFVRPILLIWEFFGKKGV